MSVRRSFSHGVGIAVLLLGLTRALPAWAADAAIEAAADAYLRPLQSLDLFQGVVLIGRGERLLVEKGYGLANIELRIPNTPAGVFRIASLTKPFTELALGKLAEEKRLSLSDPLARYLPDFPQGDHITIDMLRTHRAGVANLNSIPYDEEARGQNTLDSLVTLIARQPLAFEPGSRSRYSNGGYALLAAVIEKVTGQKYGEYLEQAILRPLGLDQTRHETDQMLVPGRAYGYTVNPEQRGEMIVAPYQEMGTKTGGGSLVSTAADLRRFLRSMYRDNVIRADTWRTLFPPDSIFSYQGRCPGFNVVMRRDLMNDVDVVILSNDYAAGMVGTIASDFRDLALGLRPAAPRWRDLQPDSTRALGILGTYRASRPGVLPYGDGPFTLRWHKGDLVLYRDNTPLDVLIPQGNDMYLLRTMWSEGHFAPTEGGKSAVAALRPLWFTTDAVPLERVADQ